MSKGELTIINVSSSGKGQILDISEHVSGIIRSHKEKNGIVYVFIPHTTAGITINENADPDVRKDMLMGLEHIVSDNLAYRHAEGNSTAHIKASLIGSSVTVFFENNELVLGSWQGIFLCEFDGPRSRKIFVKVMGS